MRLSVLLPLLSLNLLVSAAPSIPVDTQSLSERAEDTSIQQNVHDLEKRRGGGGGGGGRGGGGGGGGSRGGGGGGSGRPISSYSFSGQNNAGGRTISGSGQKPAYGTRYMGGTSVPYTAGGTSPSRGISPGLYPIAFFPGIWFFPVYAYPFGGYGYHWNDGGRNRTANVTCLCQQYNVCGCDPTDNTTLIAQMVTDGKGSGAPVNTSTVRTIDWGNGSTISYINGTLDNGTTAPGGTDPSDESQISGAARLVINYSGYWLMIGTVIAGVTMM